MATNGQKSQDLRSADKNTNRNSHTQDGYTPPPAPLKKGYVPPPPPPSKPPSKKR